MLPLSGADSMSSQLKPSAVKFWARCFAAFVSFPGGLVVFMRMSSLRRFVTSASTSFRGCRGISWAPMLDVERA